jgi:hypothetical protein
MLLLLEQFILLKLKNKNMATTPIFQFYNCELACDICMVRANKQNKLRGFSPPANYTDRATAACRRS